MNQKEKLSALRQQMKNQGIDGFFVPRADEFQGEYVPHRARRLRWISGFTGSAGSVVVLQDKASFFTDGRYTIQAREQIDKDLFEICSTSEDQLPTPTITPTKWIEKNLPKGAKFGVDPWLHTAEQVKELKWAVETAEGKLVFVKPNPLDSVWKDKPEAPMSPAVVHDLRFAGQASEQKMEAITPLMQGNADVFVLTSPDDICWLLNVRGSDVPYNPFVLSYALFYSSGELDWFVDSRKITEDVINWVPNTVKIKEFEEFSSALMQLAQEKKTFWIDDKLTPVEVNNIVVKNGGTIYLAASPIQLMKAKKNKVEIEGAVNAHIRDGAAFIRFLAMMDERKDLNEIEAENILYRMRKDNDLFKGLSFATISGAGSNGAIVHYRATEESNKPLNAGPLYLVDSGAQYQDGTTDITRVLPTGKITDEIKENFTRVLKGHIQLAMAKFPQGTFGSELDKKARQFLKEAGLDYAHGTGHGVGSYLSVHEGPCTISPKSTTVPLEEGMILSNEPGYYKEGEYGIRIENLVVVMGTSKKDEQGKKMLCFRTLTLVPICLELIKKEMLDDEELNWLNSYHKTVRETLWPHLKSFKEIEFIKKATVKL